MRERYLKRVYQDACEVELADFGFDAHDILPEQFTALQLGVLGEIEEAEVGLVREEVRVDAALEVDRRNLAQVHANRLLDLVELGEDPLASCLYRRGDEGDLK